MFINVSIRIFFVLGLEIVGRECIEWFKIFCMICVIDRLRLVNRFFCYRVLICVFFINFGFVN